MTKHRWTTSDQREWLEQHLTAFLEAQAKDETSSIFFPEIHKLWVAKFGYPDATEKEIEEANGNVEQANAKIIKQTEKRISQWFHNTTRPSAGSGRQNIIKIKSNPKMPADWQAYQTLYYDIKLKDIVDEEYKTYCKGLKEGEKRKPRIKVQSEVVRAQYKNESAEVKAEVEEYRKKLKQEPGRLVPDKKLEVFNTGIERLPASLAAMIKGLQQETGWSFTVLAGGPSPRHNGKIMTYIMHSGSAAGKPTEQFEQFVGKTAWNENVLSQWDAFLHSIYPPDVRAAHSLSPSSEEGALDDKQDEDVDEDSAPGDKPRMASEEASDVEPGQHSSEFNYQNQKRKNIAENKKIIDQLKKIYVPPELPQEGTAGSTKNKKQTAKKGGMKVRDNARKDCGATVADKASTANLNAHSESQPLTHVSTHTSTHISASSNPSQNSQNDATSVADRRSSGEPRTESASATTPSSTTTATPPSFGELQTPTELAAATVVSSTAATTTQSVEPASLNAPDSAPPSNGPPPAADAKTVSSTAATRTQSVEPTSLNAPDSAPPTDGPPPAADAKTADGNELDTRIAHPKSSDRVGDLEQVNKEVVEKSSAMEIDPKRTEHSFDYKPASSTEPRLLRNNKTRSDNFASAVVKSRPPISSSSAYISDTEPYLKEVSTNETWLALVEMWLEFERVYPVKGNINTANRPVEIGWWQKRARKVKTVPLITDPDAFSTQWRLWWMSMQPEWRALDARWPPSRTVPEDVMMTLSWWAQAVDSEVQTQLDDFLSALDDVLWVLAQMMLDVRLSKKRAADDDEPAAGSKPVSKRTRKI